MGAASLNAELAAIAEANNIDRIGFCSADSFDDVRSELHARKAKGLSADMQFTYRNPDRATDPSRTLPGAKSIVVGARSYRRAPATADVSPAGQAQIAEYVWEPHYTELRSGLDALAEHLTASGWKARVLIDDNALVDRAAAYRAGIGWWGKNSNILVPGVGSRFVLGSVITDAPLTPADGPLDDQCGPCRRCFDACPTDAIVADGVIDSNRCLAWLVQSPGVFPREYRSALGDRIYGCDDCQTACPPNLGHDRKNERPVTTGVSSVPVEELLTLDDEELMKRFGAWYIPRREPRYLRRNALVVLGNVADRTSDDVKALVQRFAASDDDIERSHAVWAADQLGYDDLVDAASGDSSEFVQKELSAIRATR